MLQLEFRFRGNPKVDKEMEAYFPRKTAKQIRDKRKESSYKTLFETYLKGQATAADHTMDEAMDEVMDSHPAENTDTPILNPLAGETQDIAVDTTGPAMGQHINTQAWELPEQPDPNDNWVHLIIDQTSETTSTIDTASEEYRNLYACPTDIMKEIKDNRKTVTKNP